MSVLLQLQKSAHPPPSLIHYSRVCLYTTPFSIHTVDNKTSRKIFLNLITPRATLARDFPFWLPKNIVYMIFTFMGHVTDMASV